MLESALDSICWKRGCEERLGRRGFKFSLCLSTFWISLEERLVKRFFFISSLSFLKILKTSRSGGVSSFGISFSIPLSLMESCSAMVVNRVELLLFKAYCIYYT